MGPPSFYLRWGFSGGRAPRDASITPEISHLGLEVLLAEEFEQLVVGGCKVLGLDPGFAHHGHEI